MSHRARMENHKNINERLRMERYSLPLLIESRVLLIKHINTYLEL